MTITEFLLARIAEDEAAARRDLASDAWGNPYGDGAGIELTFTAERVLAECAAKRRIVELHQPLPGGEFCSTCDVATVGDSWPCATIRALASIWADHPDYRKEWA